MSNINTTTAAVLIPEVWSADTIKDTESNLVLAPLVTRYDRDCKFGDTVHVGTISNFEANDKVANVATSPQANTETDLEIAIDNHKEVTFLIEDIVEVQSNKNLRSEYTKKAGYAISKSIDSAIAALASGFSNTKGIYNTAITTDVILDSIELLDLADVPEMDRYFAFRPDVKRDLLDIATYTSSDYVDGNPVRTGKIGALYGVETFMSTNIVKTGSNTDNMLFHKEALALAMQRNPRTTSDWSQPHLANMVTVDSVFGVKERRDNFGVLIKT